ncbi:MAG: hypothetical protein CMN72_12135 [Sphingomonas sp.]|nr:hypothetical protein [Sphingomonas sp.]|tara:strand:+ start:850 stop:1203 length:354 start_codon:yes stop_codon:yes gene_type:complete
MMRAAGPATKSGKPLCQPRGHPLAIRCRNAVFASGQSRRTWQLRDIIADGFYIRCGLIGNYSDHSERRFCSLRSDISQALDDRTVEHGKPRLAIPDYDNGWSDQRNLPVTKITNLIS